MKFLILFIFPFLLIASLSMPTNHTKELAVLEAFDIEPSFLYDPIMNDMLESISSDSKSWYYFKAMSDADLYIPVVKNLLSQNSIPQEFLYLAMAESNFSNQALSNRAASGLWQFMPRTAGVFNLRIDDYVDERRDIFKSTNAASKYLKDLHKRFGKWYLAAIAYNCGGGKLSRAIREAGSDELSVLLDPDKKYIPKESRFYIRKIVALAILGHNERYLLESKNEHLLNRANAHSVAVVKVPSGESLNRVAKIIDMQLEDLQKLNRHLNYDFIPPYAKNYAIYIPYDKLSSFNTKYTQETIKSLYKIHIVSRGDNMSSIGKKYGVAYKIIMEFNNMKSSSLKLKQKIIIPIVGNAKVAQKKVDKSKYYMVKAGDSLGSIAKVHKVSVQNLKKKNQLSSSVIKIGEKLKL